MATRDGVKRNASTSAPRVESEALATDPAQFFDDFLPVLAGDKARSIVEVAAGIGSRDVNQPKRAIQRFLDAGKLFGLVDVYEGRVMLTGRGRSSFASVDRRRSAVRRAFATEPVPRDVAALIGPGLRYDQFLRRLAVLARSGEADAWLRWLAEGQLVSVEGSTIKAHGDALSPLEALDEIGFAAVEEIVYRRLQMNEETLGEAASLRVRRHAQIFRSAKSEDAEAAMHSIVREGLAALGFTVQTRNGPRDGDAELSHLRFGAKGDDAMALYISEGIAISSVCWGWGLGIELKRTYVDKKAVTQAAAAESRLKLHYGERLKTLPIVISGEPGFADQAGREYAESHGVVHVPIDAVVALVEEQQRRVATGERLITPVDVLGAIHRWRAKVNLAPTKTDVLDEVLLRVRGAARGATHEQRTSGDAPR